MKSWAHNHQDNIHALWNSVSFWLVMFYINKITLHIFPMTFHTAVCLRRVSLTVNIAVTINSCIWNYYKSSTMYSVNFSTNGHLNHLWFLTMKILLCQTSLYKHLCVYMSVLLENFLKMGFLGQWLWAFKKATIILPWKKGLTTSYQHKKGSIFHILFI